MRKKTRKKAVVVYGRFESSKDTHVETWTGAVRSMAVGMRQAILDMFQRPSVKGKHYYRVSVTGEKEGE